MDSTSTPIRIVVAEDEELIMNNLIRKIENIDPSLQVVCAAEDGKEALSYVRDNPVDLVVTDIHMPVMNGISLIRELHLHFPHIRAVITTGYADFEYARQALRFQVSEYLLKPIKQEELRQAISRVKLSIDSEKSSYRNSLESMRAGSDKPETIVQLVQQYLKENFTRELSLEEVAKSFNFTSSYLSKIFIKHTGAAPSKYLIALRINEAKYLLTEHRHLSVKEVGERIGYPDQFYFSRLFKQVTGSTPKEFQK
ncbi:response regulator transcription factor [Cohnella boryungensis]|uniref:Response regulator n=1 Tax=Cohnella boryungensis TaxID=768479 RepID=A0ABV8SKW0_9BACL